ncbi:MAG: ABC transporter ATP-binding protein [Hyphomicrobiales bacterium]
MTLSVSVEEKAFGARAVLKDLAFTLADGEFLALVGPSGCGKTTLLRIIAGLDPDFRGTVSPPGEVAVVFQEPRLLPWRTVAENVALPLPGEPGLPENRRWAEAALAEVGLGAEGDTYPRALSLGMARRVALARAVAVRPSLLILDEPFVSLDAESAATMRALVRRVAAELKATVILVTHDLEDALDLSARIIRLAGQPAGIAADLRLDASPADRSAPWRRSVMERLG